jgi:uncharacterized membrane protein
MRIIAVLAAAALLVACGDPNRSENAGVLDGHVVRVLQTGDRAGQGIGMRQPFQRLEVQLDGGLYRGDVVQIEWGGRRALDENGFLAAGDKVLLSETRDGSERRYTIVEIVRLPSLTPVVVVFVVALLAVARLKGLAALAGLASSIAVFLLAIVPALRAGDDPLRATLVGAAGVVTLSVFVVHGLNRKSAAALVGTLCGLAAVAAIGAIGLGLAHITGLATEDQIFVAVGTDGRVDMPKLALAGVIVGSLGALVDMSVGQSSATAELAAVDPELRGRRLYRSALSVGRDHIGSLVNTLGLAYFGGALPLVVLLSIGYQPLAVSLNSEEIIASILTVVAAGIGLVLCVPITTAVAVAFADRS